MLKIAYTLLFNDYHFLNVVFIKVSLFVIFILLKEFFMFISCSIAANRSEWFGFVPIWLFEYENLIFSLKIRIFRNSLFLPYALIFNSFYVPVANEHNEKFLKKFLCSFIYIFFFNVSLKYISRFLFTICFI